MMVPRPDLDDVADVIQEVEAAEIAPRFRQLGTGDVFEKSPGEIVTAADRACELRLSERLRNLVDVPVVGEEAAAADPSLLDLVDEREAVWLVDPLDGTSNFATGSPDYAVMVAFVAGGEAAASWIWHPSSAGMYVAERGSGALCNGERLEMGRSPSGALTGVVKTRFLPIETATVVTDNEVRFAGYLEGRGCAGVEYPSLVARHVDFLLYWRTLPWDHAPGALLVEEAGGAVVRPDGRRYRCGESAGGLVAAHAGVIDEVRRRLFARSGRSDVSSVGRVPPR